MSSRRKPRPPSSALWVHLAAILCLLVATGIACTLAVSLQRHRKDHTETLFLALQQAAHLEAVLLRADGAGDIQSRVSDAGRASGYRITVISSDGRVLGDSEHNPESMDDHAGRPEIRTALAGETGRSVRFSHTIHKDMLYCAVPWVQDGRVVGAIRLAVARSSLREALAAFRNELFWLSGFLLVGAVALALFVARKLATPLESMTRAAGELAAGNWDAWLPSPRVRELAELSDALQSLAHNLRERTRALSELLARQQALLDGMSEPVIAVDAGGRILQVNASAAGLFRVDPAASEGRLLSEAIRQDDLLDIAARVARDAKPVEGSLTVLVPKARHLLVHAVPLRLPAEARTGAVIVLTDITQIRRLEAAQRDFVTNASHELRTPVTSILGYAETLSEGAHDPEAVTRFARTIARHAHRLSDLISDLLELRQAETIGEGGAVERQVTDIPALVGDCVEKYRTVADERRMRIDVQVPVGLRAAVLPRLLDIALGNLLQNAFAYSEPDRMVRVTAGVDNDTLTVAVQDQGWGIPREHLPRIFERFYRVDKSRSRASGGTGLGLAIAREAIEAQGGTLTAESELGKGSVFTIRIPNAAAPASA